MSDQINHLMHEIKRRLNDFNFSSEDNHYLIEEAEELLDSLMIYLMRGVSVDARKMQEESSREIEVDIT